MAEFGAHLTSATTFERPSFFEVLAQESLMGTLRPAMTYLIKVLAEHNPARYGALIKYADEIYTSLDLLLQHHFLSTTCASFAENFYSLKRVSAKSLGEGLPARAAAHRLLRWQHARSLLFLVLVPYLKLKLERLFERWKEESLDRPLQGPNTELHKLRRIFMAVFPFLHMTWESVIFVYQLRYLLHKSDCHSPFLKLAGVRLTYMSMEDIQGQMGGTGTDAPLVSSLRGRVARYLRRAVGLLAVSLSQGLSVGIFFLQFLEWWYASQDHQTRLAVTALPIPKPPTVEPSTSAALPKDPQACPLCQKHRTNDTALSTSGFVFCYPCVYTFVKGHRSCPVTGYPTELRHLVKLYPPDS